MRRLDTCPITAQSLESCYHIDGVQLERHYKEHLSDYPTWEQADHAQEWLLFPRNMGIHLSIDETSLSNGELYTIITNKATKGGKGAIVAIISGTKAEDIIAVLEKLPGELIDKVKEVTLDMSDSMRIITRHCFPRAQIFMCNGWPLMPYRRCVLPIGGMTSTMRQTAEKGRNSPGKHTPRRCFQTEIPENNYLPEAATCCSNLPRNGRNHKKEEQKYYLTCIRTLNRLIPLPIPLE